MDLLRQYLMLDGMFAIGAFNFKHKSLWLARDKFGKVNIMEIIRKFFSL